jgi:CBS domain-containing protein
MLVKKIMQSPVIVINRAETVSHARKTMMKERLSRLVVVDGSRPVGTLTRRDIIKNLGDYKMRQRDLDSILVDEIMKTPVTTIGEDDTVEEAAKRMVDKNVRGLPVVDPRGELVGIITKTDLTKHFAEDHSGKLKVKDLYQPMESVPTVNVTHSISRAMDLIQDRAIDRVVVLDGKRPIGIITESDLALLAPRKGRTPFHKGKVKGIEVSQTRIYLIPTAEDVMTSNPKVVEANGDAAQAAMRLIDEGIGGMPVVDKKGEMIGLITKFDFVRFLAKEGEE